MILGLLQLPGALQAQQRPWISLMGEAIGVATSVERVPAGAGRTEVRVVQPMLMAHGGMLDGRLRFTGTLNLEGLTIPNGELLPGGWGEGYTDRRHPHTYAHELMLTGQDLLHGRGGLRLSMSAGKGFVAFGSDDPMNRPVFRYPVNHHLSQIMERAVAIIGIRTGPVAFEGSLFNGDEPERPGQWPLLRRFGDSWAARLTVLPMDGVELGLSRAKVHSPEHRPGAGTDAMKWHLSARLDRAAFGGRLYVMTEWARTEEAKGFFVFTSLLAEAALRRGRHQAWYRFERTDRPEDARTSDPFRSVRPHLENSIVGTTRWSLHSLGYGFDLAGAGKGLSVAPFVEGTIGRVWNLDGGVFNPAVFYGSAHVASVSAGVRLSWRLTGHRMGRYGGLLDAPGAPDSHRHVM